MAEILIGTPVENPDKPIVATLPNTVIPSNNIQDILQQGGLLPSTLVQNPDYKKSNVATVVTLNNNGQGNSVVTVPQPIKAPTEQQVGLLPPQSVVAMDGTNRITRQLTPANPINSLYVRKNSTYDKIPLDEAVSTLTNGNYGLGYTLPNTPAVPVIPNNNSIPKVLDKNNISQQIGLLEALDTATNGEYDPEYKDQGQSREAFKARVTMLPELLSMVGNGLAAMGSNDAVSMLDDNGYRPSKEVRIEGKDIPILDKLYKNKYWDVTAPAETTAAKVAGLESALLSPGGNLLDAYKFVKSLLGSTSTITKASKEVKQAESIIKDAQDISKNLQNERKALTEEEQIAANKSNTNKVTVDDYKVVSEPDENGYTNFLEPKSEYKPYRDKNGYIKGQYEVKPVENGTPVEPVKEVKGEVIKNPEKNIKFDRATEDKFDTPAYAREQTLDQVEGFKYDHNDPYGKTPNTRKEKTPREEILNERQRVEREENKASEVTEETPQSSAVSREQQFDNAANKTTDRQRGEEHGAGPKVENEEKGQSTSQQQQQTSQKQEEQSSSAQSEGKTEEQYRADKFKEAASKATGKAVDTVVDIYHNPWKALGKGIKKVATSYPGMAVEGITGIAAGTSWLNSQNDTKENLNAFANVQNEAKKKNETRETQLNTATEKAKASTTSSSTAQSIETSFTPDEIAALKKGANGDNKKIYNAIASTAGILKEALRGKKSKHETDTAKEERILRSIEQLHGLDRQEALASLKYLYQNGNLVKPQHRVLAKKMYDYLIEDSNPKLSPREREYSKLRIQKEFTGNSKYEKELFEKQEKARKELKESSIKSRELVDELAKQAVGLKKDGSVQDWNKSNLSDESREHIAQAFAIIRDNKWAFPNMKAAYDALTRMLNETSRVHTDKTYNISTLTLGESRHNLSFNDFNFNDTDNMTGAEIVGKFIRYCKVEGIKLNTALPSELSENIVDADRLNYTDNK